MPWRKVKVAAQHFGVSERTVRTWLQEGLPHSRLPSGTVLIELSAGDAWLRAFNVDDTSTTAVDQLLRKLK